MVKQSDIPTFKFNKYDETDIEESYFGNIHNLHCLSTSKLRHRLRRSHRTSSRKLEAAPMYEKIMRFPFKSAKKTLRVYCFNDFDLNIPRRFEKQLKVAQIDNDIESDEEIVDGAVQDGERWLREGIKENSNEIKEGK